MQSTEGQLGLGLGLGLGLVRVRVGVRVSRVSSCSYTRVRKRISMAPN